MAVSTIPAKFTDTDDATLNSGGQLLSGVTAYAGGTKYTGTMVVPTATQDSTTKIVTIA